MNKDKKPLYRKVNTKARGVRHFRGGDYKDHRRRKESAIGMQQGVQRGLDYTPLYKFLLSKVGEHWDSVHSEAVSRLPNQDPIFRMVSLNRSEAEDYIRVGESSYFSGLYVDENRVLRLTDSTINESTLEPTCGCCTHTFNG